MRVNPYSTSGNNPYTPDGGTVVSQYYNPQDGRMTNNVIRQPNGTTTVYSNNAQGNKGARTTYGANGARTSSVGYDPNEGTGTLTYVTNNPDGSRQVDKGEGNQKTSYTVDPNGQMRDLSTKQMGPQDQQTFNDWKSGFNQSQGQNEGSTRAQSNGVDAFNDSRGQAGFGMDRGAGSARDTPGGSGDGFQRIDSPSTPASSLGNLGMDRGAGNAHDTPGGSGDGFQRIDNPSTPASGLSNLGMDRGAGSAHDTPGGSGDGFQRVDNPSTPASSTSNAQANATTPNNSQSARDRDTQSFGGSRSNPSYMDDSAHADSPSAQGNNPLDYQAEQQPADTDREPSIDSSAMNTEDSTQQPDSPETDNASTRQSSPDADNAAPDASSSSSNVDHTSSETASS